ncbi:MAG: capsular polysaccharide synthesis protein [Lachnospiraceae bacterium]
MYYSKKILGFLRLELWLLKNFGARAAWYDFLKTFVFRKDSGCGKEIEYRKYENLKRILSKKYRGIIEEYKEKRSDPEEIGPEAPLWVFWWQGIGADTPQVVLDCIENLKKYHSAHPIHVVTQYNLKEYIALPPSILKKVEKQELSLCALSDIIRVELLYQHGGIWLDATVFLTQPLDHYMCGYSFYTIRHGLFSDFHVCKGLWSCFLLAGGAGSPLFGFMRSMFQAYFAEYTYVAAYLLIDCFLAIAYEEIPYLREMVNQVPLNNTQVFYLDDHGNEEYKEAEFAAVCQGTHLFKMHYKRHFVRRTQTGQLTKYGHVVTAK